MLTPSLRRRWLFGFLVLAKLALIVFLLRGMMVCFPLEVLPFVTGLLLFSASILLEAFWLIFRRPTELPRSHPWNTMLRFSRSC